MDWSFGTRLREQRERRQLSLAAIADETKIKASLLEGLERDDVSHWPHGIFRRSYVRSYARAIGLDADVTLRDFLAAHPEPLEASTLDLAQARGAGKATAGERPQTRLGFLINSAVAVLPSRRLPERDRNAAAPPAKVEREETANRAAIDLSALARLCARLSCAERPAEVSAVLGDAATLLDAVGAIVWLWDPRALKLRPVLSHGYPDDVVARFPLVPRDDENGIAMAFRSAATCVIDGSDLGPGAVVVPLRTPAACTGVLALELRHRAEAQEPVRACATILAAQLSTIVGCASFVDADLSESRRA